MKKYLDKIILGVAIVLALVAIFMMFAPAVASKELDTTYSGFEAAFGKKESAYGMELKVLDASAAILPLLLLIVGICLTVVALLNKGGIIVPIVAAVVFLVAGVLYFMSGLLLSPHYYQEYYGEMFPTKADYVKYLRENFNVGIGAIVGGVFSILAAIVAVVPVVLKKIQK